MLLDLSPTLIVIFAFGAVAVAVYVMGQVVSVQMRVRQRTAAPKLEASAAPSFGSNLDVLVATYFDETRFGVAGSVRAKLRKDLIRAGFFRPDAINYYIFARLLTVIVLPILAYIFAEQFMTNREWYLKLSLVMIAMLLGVVGPDAYIARRQRRLHERYRITFPDMLDLMVVCLDAGLSLEAALNRVSSDVMRQNRQLGSNLMLLGAEMRAGRSTVDALDSIAGLLGLDEARSLVAMLRQSVELGTDVGDALRVFSDEMRDRRLLRAEERANQLPVKMVGPLGLCIFPVILGLVMLPVIIRLISVLK
jgi:tight adherence protein C